MFGYTRNMSSGLSLVLKSPLLPVKSPDLSISCGYSFSHSTNELELVFQIWLSTLTAGGWRHWGVSPSSSFSILGQKKRTEGTRWSRTGQKTHLRARKVKRWRWNKESEQSCTKLILTESHCAHQERFPHLTEVTAALKADLWPHCKCHSHLKHSSDIHKGLHLL